MKQKELKKIAKISIGIVDIILEFIILALATVSIILHNLSGWALETWQNLSADEVVFHLKAPVEGTNEDLILDAVQKCLPGGVLVFLLILTLFAGTYRSRKWRAVLSAVIVAFSIGMVYSAGQDVWRELELEDYIEKQKTESTFIQDHYVDARNIALEFPEQKRNLIYIFLESMEATYADKESGGAFEDNCIPQLTELAERNLSFSDKEKIGGAYQTVGTTWTMGAMFAQTTGLPLKIPIGANDMEHQEQFLPGVVSIGDILEEEGYEQVLMVGSAASFGGRENYFKQHGDYDIWDFYTALDEVKIPWDYKEWWGFEDEKLFAFAKEELLELSKKGRPFNFTMLTADTHAEDGYTCRLCDMSIEDAYARALDCSSRQTAEFVEWISQQEFYENTTVVIAGDHLTMDADFCDDVPEAYERTVYNVFINSAVAPEQAKSRGFTTMDFFPSTLASMGVQIEGDRIGLGTNLFGGGKTLAEEVGISELDAELENKSSFFENFTKNIQK